MKVDEQVIRKLFPQFWKTVKDKVLFKSAGKSIKVDKFPLFGLSTIEECESDSLLDYKCHCQIRNFRLQSESVDKVYDGELDLIIGADCSGPKPIEFIKAIKDNTIFVKSK